MVRAQNALTGGKLIRCEPQSIAVLRCVKLLPARIHAINRIHGFLFGVAINEERRQACDTCSCSSNTCACPKNR
jgi:hypothetical protein